MLPRDLRIAAPRRWIESVDGIRWLPRLIDKARSAHNGMLGSYLYGQSPMDRSLLRALQLGHTEFARIVRLHTTDDAVIEALRGRDPDSLERARRWSAALHRRYWWFLFVLDVDDGYAGGIWKAMKPAVNLSANTLTWIMKRVWPSRAIERSKLP